MGSAMMDMSIDVSGLPIDTSEPVLVTGANGYVASWVVKGLLDAGVTVHAAVRKPDDAHKVGHLLKLAENAPGQLKLFAADLLSPHSYEKAMAGCTVVLHMASPFIRNVSDPMRDLVKPALEGTRNVLNSAGQHSDVRRVVLTSSVAAIYSDAVDVESRPNGIITEAQWNDTSSKTREPYSYSKTLAEREAWHIAQAQQQWRLVTINPALVIGPALNPHPSSDSFTIVKQMISGTGRFGLPKIGVSVVDVRDVARAHIAAAFLPDASGRHILASEDTDTLSLATSLRPRFGAQLPLPSRGLPKALVYAIAPLIGLDRGYVQRNVEHVLRADASKSRRDLGMTYRPAQESMEDMVQCILGGEPNSPK
ncbi:MAG: NAD-dependent epimerase/dehydratase family protein [Bifidobacterium sp.]|jgi:dihydroflavonol-4-reductase|nr:NAD-dependent epimerase/dehydratase family protein [Bifidobacterium sp.]MCH4175188.1 NAD-dependent epimerase/dehydratase family protein [Bifidobacterium sp.]